MKIMKTHGTVYKLLVILVSASLLLVSVSFALNRKYEAYSDTLTKKPYYDGVKSTIDHVDPPVNTMATAAWCGIDNAKTGGKWMWIQLGWAKFKDDTAKIYWEYTPETGSAGYARGFIGAPAASETYQVSHEGANAEWKHGVISYKTVAWTNFDAKNFCKAQYGAEMLDDPDDHTPGKATNKNKFASTQVRKVAGAFAAAPLATETDQAANGEIEKYTGAGNFRIWDSRD